jgi:hypothetical protein
VLLFAEVTRLDSLAANTGTWNCRPLSRLVVCNERCGSLYGSEPPRDTLQSIGPEAEKGVADGHVALAARVNFERRLAEIIVSALRNRWNGD